MREPPSFSRLSEACTQLEDETTLVRLAAQDLSAACPRGLSLVYTLRGHPARTLGSAAGMLEGSDARHFDLSRFGRVFERAKLYYDRYRVDRAQRGRLVDLPGEWFRRSDFYPLFRPFAAMSRYLVCLGARPMGCLGLLIPEDQPTLSADERRSIAAAIRRAAGPLRVAALLAQAGAALDAVNHLMGSRTEAAFLLSTGGRLLAGSSAGERALEREPGLSEALAGAVRAARARAHSLLVPGTGHELHVSPCSPRGTASAYLALLAPSLADGRARLSPRQAELIELLDLGLTNAGIACRMRLSPATVKTMLERLYRRAGVSTRVALLRWARA
jgi:DNA-binding CsgD family transcriptional regulator